MKSIPKILVAITMLMSLSWNALKAQEPILGEIRMFAGNFAPRGWMACEGQILPIAQHTALYSIVGNIYGGDGRTTFALPDLRGRVPMGVGRGPGLTDRKEGDNGGSETNTLNLTQLPSHKSSIPVVTVDPSNKSQTFTSGNTAVLAVGTSADSNLNTAPSGAGQSINNLQPFTVVKFIIAVEGIYPSRQ